MNDLPKNLAIGFWAVAVTLGAFGAGVYGAVNLSPHSITASAAASVPEIALEPSRLVAKSAVLYDLGTHRVLYQKNAYAQLPLASLTKLFAVETVLSVKSPDTPVQITQRDLKSEGDSGLRVGETMLLGELIKYALVASSNDAMTAAANSLGENSIVQMNEAAKAMGLTQTHFFNATGLDINQTTSGAYGSAYDAARLAAIFYKHHPYFFELTTRPEVYIDRNGKELVAEATALPLQGIPGFVAAKTGYTDLAGGNVVAVFDLEPGLTVVGAVLGSTREGRFEDMKTLIQAARQSL